MPSASLLVQSLISGVLLGGLYCLLGLGLSLSWRFLRIINLAYFGLIYLAAYFAYHLVGAEGMHPLVALLLIVPVFFLIGVILQLLFARFSVGEFASLIISFGMLILVETLIQWIWTADFRRLETPYATASWKLGGAFIPVTEAVMFVMAVALATGIWCWLRFSYVGKALRASVDDADMAASFGVDHRRLSLLLSGVGMALAAVAGVVVALITTLAPAQISAWIGVLFAVVILGGLGNPLGMLAAGLVIGVSEALTMALTAPTWAPLVSFTLLILILVLRPNRI